MSTMPFGKYCGYELDELPGDYLRWLHEDCELREPLRSKIAREFAHREPYARARESQPPRRDERQPETALRVAAVDVPLVRAIVDSGYRVLAKDNHPDLGGDAARMVRLNAVAASLRAQLGALEGVR